MHREKIGPKNLSGLGCLGAGYHLGGVSCFHLPLDEATFKVPRPLLQAWFQSNGQPPI
jgi:hypothetical protein